MRPLDNLKVYINLSDYYKNFERDTKISETLLIFLLDNKFEKISIMGLKFHFW